MTLGELPPYEKGHEVRKMIAEKTPYSMLDDEWQEVIITQLNRIMSMKDLDNMPIAERYAFVLGALQGIIGFKMTFSFELKQRLDRLGIDRMGDF